MQLKRFCAFHYFINSFASLAQTPPQVTELKKAYHHKMNQHHPDKLVSRGTPEEMVKMATEKTQEIKAAYELIVEERKK